MKHKTFDLIETKADGEAGQFTALASVFGNVDHVGDRVMPGAFKKTLEQWRGSGKPMPIVLSHQWDDPFAMIGKADPRAVIETEDGLLVQGQLDIEDNATAKQVHKLMKEGLLTGWSFGYTVPDGGEQLNKDDGANELTEIDLVEVGPTLKGANSEAQLQAVKSALKEETKVEEQYDRKTVADLAPVTVVSGLSTTTTGTDTTVTITDHTNLPVEEPEVPDEDVPEKVENVESEKSESPPAAPAAKDPLKNQIDRALIDIALGR